MNLRAEKHNQIREYILKILAPEHPRPVDAVIVRRCLANFNYPMDADTLGSYLAYLEERGYVRVEKIKNYDIVMVSITADGLDILDRRIKDRGVGVEI